MVSISRTKLQKIALRLSTVHEQQQYLKLEG